MMRLFISQVINTCAIIMIANLDLSDVSFIDYIHQNVPGGKYLFTGLYPDFTRFWYVKVGMSLLVLKAIGVIWPQILSIVFMVPVCALKRVWCAHKAVIQVDMNKYYEGLNINLWDRYASALSGTVYTLMFCPGIPLLLPLQALGLLSQYWIDKILCKIRFPICLVVKYGRRPPVYGTQLNSRAYKIMPLALCYHMLCALIMYTCPQIYPLSVDEDNSTGVTFYTGRSISFVSRVPCETVTCVL